MQEDGRWREMEGRGGRFLITKPEPPVRRQEVPSCRGAPRCQPPLSSSPSSGITGGGGWEERRRWDNRAEPEVK